MNDAIIKTDNVKFTYPSHMEGKAGTEALKGISAEIKKGQFVVVLGRNGSGKSTLARLMNALLIPTQGVVYVKNINTSDGKHIWEIRRSCGMVFQNPDNQIIGTTVEEDTAFGPENLGVKSEVIRQRVDDALESVGMLEYSKHAPHLLSGGQKQRVSIAGILAMKPECIILDEATAMLDPGGRREVIGVVRKLNKEENITVIHITHHMEEAVHADNIIVVDRGQVILEGKPEEVFAKVEEIKEIGLDVPQITELFYELEKDGISFSKGILNIEDAVNEVSRLLKRK